MKSKFRITKEEIQVVADRNDTGIKINSVIWLGPECYQIYWTLITSKGLIINEESRCIGGDEHSLIYDILIDLSASIRLNDNEYEMHFGYKKIEEYV